MKTKIKELITNSNIKNIRDLYRGINDFKKGYQPRTHIVQNDKGDLVTDSQIIVARRRSYFSQLLNVHTVNVVRHTADSEVGTATRYGLDGPGVESRWGRDFPHPSRPTLVPTQPPIEWVPGQSPRGKADGAWL